MKFEDIRKTIEEDYSNVVQARVVKGGRAPKAFYANFIIALKELHTSISPFITSKEQFIEHIKYIKDNVSPEVYDAITTYCRDKLKIKIER